METFTEIEIAEPQSWVQEEIEVSVATYQAYRILYFTFIGILAFAGLDKFFRVITDWERYVSPRLGSTLHLSAGGMTMLAGVIELTVALAITLKPRYGSWAFFAWLVLITINLLTMHGYYETILWTATLAMTSLAFARLAAECN